MAVKDGIYSASSDRSIRKWKNGATQFEKEIKLANNCYSLAISEDEEILVSGGLSKDIILHNLINGQEHTLSGHSFRINSLQLRGKFLISGSNDKHMRVWDIQEKISIVEIPCDYPVTSALLDS